MYYFGINYCRVKSCCSFWGWLFWWIGRRMDTYFPDVKQHRFLRLFGIECKLIWWEPQSKRAELPADPRVFYMDGYGKGWQMKPVTWNEYNSSFEQISGTPNH